MRMAQRSFLRGEVCFARSCLAGIFLVLLGFPAFSAESKRSFHQVVSHQGTVEILRKGAAVWLPATTNLTLVSGDSIRTGPASRAAIRLANESVISMDQLSTIRFPEPASPRKRFLVNLLRGAAYFFHRERPVETDFETPLVSGAIRGTEFNLAVAENGRTVITLIDGEVELSNPQGQLALHSGDQAVVEPGTAPARSAVLEAVNVIQWNLYYPAVLDPVELRFSDAEKQALALSLAAYRSGDLLTALKAYSAGRQPASGTEIVYLAQIQLAVGQVTAAEQLLGRVSATDRASRDLAAALRTLIAAVKLTPTTAVLNEQSASALIAKSYYDQSIKRLDVALEDARQAVQLSSDFGFAWARLAELEFSFGHTREALAQITEALRLSPRNAQAWTVQGFLFSTQGKYRDARSAFDTATGLDSGLGNAWLGRGLCLIRDGRTSPGRDDLLVAAALEPNRAILRSYLGKAFSQTWDDKRARKELDLAKGLDPKDPTAWLYSALLNQQRNRINEAIDDLEHSVELNNNRQLYRSKMLLDEDRAVRGANLASVYLDAGMEDRSFQEAVKSANADYANFSSHLFLANSYNALRDPKQVNLRYETPWLSEFLLANLLAPVQAGTLSPSVSQQEYGRLFERNRFGFAGVTEYQSSGDWMQGAVQYGIYDNFAYSADVFYRSENGQRPNNDLDQLTVSLQLKDQVTPEDSVYLQAVYYRARGGDLRQYYDQNDANIGLRTKETQEPLLIAGWHHEWSRESHTLFLAGRFQDTLKVNNPTQPIISQQLGTNGFDQFVLPLDYRSEVDIYTAELQQIWQRDPYKVIAGARFQYGDFDV